MRRQTIILAAILSLAASCSRTEKTESVTARIEAAQIEGRRAAKGLLYSQWKDSTDMKADMAAIDSISRSFPDTVMGGAFRRSFNSTLKTIRPDLYDRIK